MKRIILISLLGLGAGCVPYAATQSQLADQTQRGLEQVRQAHEQRKELLQAQLELRRRQLDQAFDEDVRTTTTLDPDWVIEHRKAYTIGTDALRAQQSASQQADITTEANMQAMEQLLKQIKSLADIEANWFK